MPRDTDEIEHRGRSRSRSPVRSSRDDKREPHERDDRGSRRAEDREDRRYRNRSRSRSRGHKHKSRSKSIERSTRRYKSRSPGGRERSGSRDRSESVNRDRKRERSHRHGRRRSRSRSRSSERDRDRRKKKRRDRSLSSRSESESDEEHRRRKKERKKEKERRKERKREKKEKKEKKHRDGGSQWGKFGIISESDIFTKSSEFYTWLVEERKINPETITKEQNRKEFAKFVEDYNTATLPHEKYYNMEAFDRRMNALRSGEFVPPAEDTYDPQADMKALKSAHKRRAVEKDSYLNREQLLELRKVQNERIEAGKMKILGMDVKQNMGVRMDGVAFD